MRENINRETALMTDEASPLSSTSANEFASHETVKHSDDEYVRYEGERIISTNTVEGYYSIFKRGMKGIYQHCSEKHLHRYLAEFDFRYSNRVRLGVDDVERTERAREGHRWQAAHVSNGSSLRGRMGKAGEKQKRKPKIRQASIRAVCRSRSKAWR